MSGKASYCYVVNGATIKCSAGTSNGVLSLPASHGYDITGEGLLNINDNQSITNIGSMGNCKNQNKLPPCVPATGTPWQGGKDDFLVGGAAALITTSVISCAKGGVISIVSDGQQV